VADVSAGLGPFIDTHVHVACADTRRFPRRPTGVGSSWWNEPDGDGANVLAAARDAGATGVVVVQAVGAYGYDSSCAASVVAASDGFSKLVTAVDFAAADLATMLEAHAGWRLFGVADGAPWLDDDRADVVWERAGALGVVVVPTIFTARLGSLRAIVERYPRVAVALDHCAFPDMGGEDGERALFALADLAAIRLKVTTHVLAAWHREDRLDEMFERVATAFGTERMGWGSDHPQHQGLTYRGKLDLARHAARNLTPEQRVQFFTGTATALGWAG
jgi:L-fuconolactonase